MNKINDPPAAAAHRRIGALAHFDAQSPRGDVGRDSLAITKYGHLGDGLYAGVDGRLQRYFRADTGGISHRNANLLSHCAAHSGSAINVSIRELSQTTIRSRQLIASAVTRSTS